jgi:hypothetical protein
LAEKTVSDTFSSASCHTEIAPAVALIAEAASSNKATFESNLHKSRRTLLDSMCKAPPKPYSAFTRTMLFSKTAPDSITSVATLIHTAPPFGFLPITELLANMTFPRTRSDADSFKEIAPP